MIIKLSAMAAVFCVTNIWNGLEPLKSTRVDVEKLLGQPAPYSKATSASDYITGTERVSVIYSTGSCKDKPNSGWNVPEGIVVSIFVEPKKEPAFLEADFDLKKFEKRRDPELFSVVYYTDEQDGVNITVDSSRNSITSITYFPKANEKGLKCVKD